MMENVTADYYSSRRIHYWHRFARMFKSSSKILPQYLDASFAIGITEETKSQFELLLPELPFIGGDRNIFTSTLVGAAIALAYIRVLEKRGLTPAVIGRILNQVYADVFTSLPGFLKWLLRRSEFSAGRQRRLRDFAEKSQMREYPENWVMDYVTGNGVDFDFGCDYWECAVLKLFRKLGAEAYMPYLCVLDYTYSHVLRTGLQRTQTLFYGSKYCDFRYKKGGLSRPGIPIENLPEYKKGTRQDVTLNDGLK